MQRTQLCNPLFFLYLIASNLCLIFNQRISCGWLLNLPTERTTSSKQRPKRVGYLTSPGGIAYIASNIYYSAWFCLFSCVYTLNEWSAEKDILSIEEITSVSYTLKGWWIHFFAGIVVFGSCIDLYITLDEDDFDDTSFGIALGLVSMIVALFYILIHYDFFSSCGLEEGGWLELSSAIFLIVCWCIGLSILTKDGMFAIFSRVLFE